MAYWVQLTEADAMDALPTDLEVAYEAWLIANPDNVGRVGELVAESALEFLQL